MVQGAYSFCQADAAEKLRIVIEDALHEQYRMYKVRIAPAADRGIE
jgi:hypothetical protein